MVETESGVGGEIDADVSTRLRFLGSLAWFLPLRANCLFCGTRPFLGLLLKAFSSAEQRGLCLSGVELTRLTVGQSKVSLLHEIRGARAGNVQT